MAGKDSPRIVRLESNNHIPRRRQQHHIPPRRVVTLQLVIPAIQLIRREPPPLPFMANLQVIIPVLLALPQQGKVVTVQVHGVSSREEDSTTFLRDLVWGRDYHPDPLVIGGIGQCDHVKVGLVDELIDAIQGEEGRVGKVDAEGGFVHHPAGLWGVVRDWRIESERMRLTYALSLGMYGMELLGPPELIIPTLKMYCELFGSVYGSSTLGSSSTSARRRLNCMEEKYTYRY